MPDDITTETTGYLHAFQSLRVDRSSGNPALHQPILLLWAFGRARQGNGRLVSWRDSERTLRKLMERHGNPGSKLDPQHPFAALRRSSIWKLEGIQDEVPQARGSSLNGWLNEHNPKGGLEPRLYALLANDETFREQAACTILQKYFPHQDWQEILVDVGLQDEPFDGFGHPPCVPEGTSFEDRKALAAAHVHRPGQAGIWGKQDEEAKSIVVSGGYPDDEDYGDTIIYTGQGGQTAGRHTHDQDLTRGNASLVNSMASGRPVRVIRGAGRHSKYAPDSGLRYDGLYRVEDYWSQEGISKFLIWRFRLRAVEANREFLTSPANPLQPDITTPPPLGNPTPGRRKTDVQRLIRSTATANWVKQTHQHSCQVCGLRIETPTGAYAEAAHIRPLGNPHLGPDEPNNILCLCPNHHVAFDFGMLTIYADLTVFDRATGGTTLLRTLPEHEISQEHLSYHRDHHAWKQASDVSEMDMPVRK
ncbi:YDG/SRA domain-containing protein [Streptomyces sp. NPDC057257]|uniref:YDG/SRA domain-containing protein n=1 Tax=Streptomyces sp. NPDC057257 TaxID=3346071 RepID=UPI00362D6E7C